MYVLFNTIMLNNMHSHGLISMCKIASIKSIKYITLYLSLKHF